mmetsp:Transcript_15490/g.25805  ORF Transcript_15490/g.25805 Transcript_15490/m.25805 type:complete len:240 (+) Transcript_15490:110-829(+)
MLRHSPFSEIRDDFLFVVRQRALDLVHIMPSRFVILTKMHQKQIRLIHHSIAHTSDRTANLSMFTSHTSTAVMDGVCHTCLVDINVLAPHGGVCHRPRMHNREVVEAFIESVNIIAWLLQHLRYASRRGVFRGHILLVHYYFKTLAHKIIQIGFSRIGVNGESKHLIYDPIDELGLLLDPAQVARGPCPVREIERYKVFLLVESSTGADADRGGDIINNRSGRDIGFGLLCCRLVLSNH